MQEKMIEDVIYKLPTGLSPFKEEMYKHLIDWKWRNITKEVGLYKKKVNGVEKVYEYDAILPESVRNAYPHIYPAVLEKLLAHQKQFHFKFHQHFHHLVSSQAANFNLFLPILLSSKANDILKQLKPDFKSLATDQLDNGFRIEFWDGNSNKEKGLLNDHSAISGTDSDIAIAYYNKDDKLCLWLIEHKLTESEFTQCGGSDSKGRNKTKHLCDKSFDEILNNKDLCYYHEASKYEYWNITEENKTFFVNSVEIKSCPFRGGMNQLWRNQLLGFAIEKQGEYKEVYFSVVKHPENDALNETIAKYKRLVSDNLKFTDFTSKDVIDVVEKVNDKELNEWSEWYKTLYF
jgi:hypothetical protein